ncbi:MAG: hypothetical protein K2Y29_00985 [Beijerinckiaceae bacterium]|nr:hypothetical protein [Beijerinckiaceae bacterium]
MKSAFSLTASLFATAIVSGALASAAWAQPIITSLPAKAFDADEIAVAVTNRSEPVLCAEKDNIQIDFTAPDVKSFRVQAVHPAYIGTIGVDRYLPDFTACDMSKDPVVATSVKKTVRRTIYETPDFQLVGYTYPTFWRAANTPVRVIDRENNIDATFREIHLMQVWTLHRERAEEVLVVYPPDGYWRARPLPFADMRWTAYGSSFLVGPVEVQERPIVDLKLITYDAQAKTFTLDFARGGSAKMSIQALDPEHMALDVTLEGSIPRNLPFASLRSMYITDINNDAARVAFKPKNAQRWGEAHVMDFKSADASEFWLGRTTASKHNTSAPDMILGKFKPEARK